MPAPLIFADADAAADAVTFASRAARVGDGAVRIRADGGRAVMTCAPLAPKGILDAMPTVMGMRILPVDPELVCDLVVAGNALTGTAGSPTVNLPDSAVRAPWAGVSPPRGGWQRGAPISSATLALAAERGIAEVARAMPQDPGEDVVHGIRASIWGIPDHALDGLPQGVAFVAHTLGFIVGAEPAATFASARWRRVSLVRGHVLVRMPPASGLTDVRPTGASR